MKSVYERLQSLNLEMDRETLDMILSDWHKITSMQSALSEKKTVVFKQMYPHLNDLITSLKERCYK